MVTFRFETWYHAQCGYCLNFSTKMVWHDCILPYQWKKESSFDSNFFFIVNRIEPQIIYNDIMYTQIQLLSSFLDVLLWFQTSWPCLNFFPLLYLSAYLCHSAPQFVFIHIAHSILGTTTQSVHLFLFNIRSRDKRVANWFWHLNILPCLISCIKPCPFIYPSPKTVMHRI